MNLRLNRTLRPHGFNAMELFVVIAIIGVLLVLLAPMITKRYARASRIKCSSNLKQVVLSFKMYAGDNEEKFPWQPKTTSAESSAENLTSQLPVWAYFQILSNELGSTKILLCPEDTNRASNVAWDFSDTTGGLDHPDGLGHPSKQNRSVSYFLGLHAAQTQPNTILTGDRKLSTSSTAVLYHSGETNLAEVSTNSAWSTRSSHAYHDGKGNYALADGSVQQATTDRLQDALKLARDSYGTNANRFLFPQ